MLLRGVALDRLLLVFCSDQIAGGALGTKLEEFYTSKGWRVSGVCSPHSLNGSPKSVAVVKPPIDLLITAAGSFRNAKIDAMELYNDWEPVIENNLTSVFKALKYAFQDGSMSANRNIVVIGSIVGSTGGFGCANYAAAKAGLVGLVRAAANEYASQNIRINLLELGYVDCGMGQRLDPKVKEAVMKMIPLKRFATVEEFLHAVDFLATTTYMTGNILTLAGGLR